MLACVACALLFSKLLLYACVYAVRIVQHAREIRARTRTLIQTHHMCRGWRNPNIHHSHASASHITVPVACTRGRNSLRAGYNHVFLFAQCVCVRYISEDTLLCRCACVWMWCVPIFISGIHATDLCRWNLIMWRPFGTKRRCETRARAAYMRSQCVQIVHYLHIMI